MPARTQKLSLALTVLARELGAAHSCISALAKEHFNLFTVHFGDTQPLVAFKRVHVCMLGCLDYAPCLYSEACTCISIVFLSDKDMKADFLLSILLNC